MAEPATDAEIEVARRQMRVGTNVELALKIIARIDAERAARERAEARVKVLKGALLDATANLAGAASAYARFAVRHQKRPAPDALFSTRKRDFEKAVARARAALKEPSNG